MGQRAEALAKDFEKAIDDLAKTVEGCSDAQWQAICGGEQWTVAATAHHVGAQFGLEMEYLTAAADGKPLPSYTWADINGINEPRAKANSACSKEVVLRQLRTEAPKVAAWLRGLTDEQLDRRSALPLADGAMVTTQQLIEGGVLIDHARAHNASIRAVL
jgi:hypothetical protein